MNLQEIFLEIINLSLQGTLVILLILMIRQCFRQQLSQLMKYSLWGIVLLRLALPFSFTSSLSVFHIMPQQSMNITSSSSHTLSKLDLISQNTQSIEAFEVISTEASKREDTSLEVSPTPYNATRIMSLIWLGGSTLVASLIIISYTKTMRQFKMNRLLLENEELEGIRFEFKVNRSVKLYRSPDVNTPLVMRIMNPCILIPNHYGLEDQQTMHYILMHEIVHIKRHDNVYKLVSLMVLSLHWFNPLVWWSYFKMLEDMESSCDEKVLKSYEEDIRGEYATSLLEVATLQQKNPVLSAFVGFGESNLKKRVKNVMFYKVKTKLSLVISFLLLSVVGCSLISNPIYRVPENETLDVIEFRDEYVSVKIEDMNILETELEVTYSITNLTDEKVSEPRFSIVTEIQRNGEIIEPSAILGGKRFNSLEPQETITFTATYDIAKPNEAIYVFTLGNNVIGDMSRGITFGMEFVAQALTTPNENIDPTTQLFPVWNHTEVSQFSDKREYVQHSGSIMTHLDTNLILSFKAPKTWTLNSNTNNITWDGNFQNGELRIGDIGILQQFKNGETINNNIYTNRESFGQVGLGYEGDVNLFESTENKAGAYYETDKFVRVIVELGNYRRAEYVVDFGNNYYGMLYFYISADVPSEQLEIYDYIVNTMSIEEE